MRVGQAETAPGDHRRRHDHDLRVLLLRRSAASGSIAEFGIGLAAAVVLDAFVLRTVLVPGRDAPVRRANWWLPGWLDRILPHLTVEPAAPGPTADAGHPAALV